MQPRRLIAALLSILAGVWLARSDVSPTLAQRLTNAAAQAAASDWPVLVGGNPARNGRSAAFGPTEPTILWQGGTSTIIVHQAVIEGNIVVSDRTMDLTEPIKGSQIEARNLSTGELLWTASLPGTHHHIQVMGLNNGRVYATRAVNQQSDYMYALDVTTGAVLWKSAFIVESAYGLNFDANGDLIIGNFRSLLKGNGATGKPVWVMYRTCPVSDTCGSTIAGDRGYIWEASADGPRISVVDLVQGRKLYSGEPIIGGSFQQVLPFVGPDGTVYAPRTQQNPVTDYLLAYTDTGKELVEKWRSPLGYVPFASFGVGPDGSVYSYSRENEVVRLDPATGAVINRSLPMQTEYAFSPRVAIDPAGVLYLSNGGYDDGVLYSFNPDLTLRWSENIPYISLSGVSLGQNNIMIVSGNGTNLRAYHTESFSTAVPTATFIATATPNATPTATTPANPQPWELSLPIIMR